MCLQQNSEAAYSAQTDLRFKDKLKDFSFRLAAKVVKMDSDKGILEHTPLQKGDTSDCENNASSQSPHEQGMKKRPARSNLYEICAANRWRPPLFECYKQDGPCHQIMYTFKVTIEIEDASRNIIECYGAPQRKKKIAADHAAEGALWYLKNIGYEMKNQ